MEDNKNMNCNMNRANGGNAFYGLGVIGAAIWFISQASGFWAVVLAILKAFIWPVFFVLEAFRFLG
ncbi:MAG: hypothetical protein ACLFM1_11045 [Bacteroidales bacterium]